MGAEAEKAKTFRVAGFGDKNFAEKKCVFLQANAEPKHREFKFRDKKCVNYIWLTTSYLVFDFDPHKKTRDFFLNLFYYYYSTTLLTMDSCD